MNRDPKWFESLVSNSTSRKGIETALRKTVHMVRSKKLVIWKYLWKKTSEGSVCSLLMPHRPLHSHHRLCVKSYFRNSSPVFTGHFRFVYQLLLGLDCLAPWLPLIWVQGLYPFNRCRSPALNGLEISFLVALPHSPLLPTIPAPSTLSSRETRTYLH